MTLHVRESSIRRFPFLYIFGKQKLSLTVRH
nr:MAG TPA: hypothetical protein [Caudoviricetes sp.]